MLGHRMRRRVPRTTSITQSSTLLSHCGQAARRSRRLINRVGADERHPSYPVVRLVTLLRTA